MSEEFNITEDTAKGLRYDERLEIRRHGMRSQYPMLVLATFLCGCASSYKLRPADETDSNVQTFFVQGYEVANSIGRESAVGLLAEKENNHLRLTVAIANLTTEQRIDAIPQNFSIYAFDEHGRRQRLQVYGPEQYLEMLESEQAFALALEGVAAGLEAARAGRSTSYTNTSINAPGMLVSGSSVTTTYDPGKAAVVRAIREGEIRSQAQEYARVNAATESGLLSRNSLFPGQSIVGDVMVRWDGNYATRYAITIPIGTDMHRFTFVADRGE